MAEYNRTYPTRLRVFDAMTPWLWLVIFWRRQYGKPWLQIEVFPPAGWRKWWLHVLEREPEPDDRPARAIYPPADAPADYSPPRRTRA